MRLAAATVVLGGLLLASCGQKPADQAKAQSIAPPVNTVQCGTVPDFVPLYADAVVSGCFKAASRVRPNHDSGTVIYTTSAAPAELLAWYRDQASVKGLTDNLSSSTMYSARDGDKRTVVIRTEARGDGTRATINWGADKGA
jgi:hypothetical protein